MNEKKNITKRRFLGFNSYQVIALIILILLLFFFGDSSIFKHRKYEKQIDELHEQIDGYRKQTEIDKKKLNELKSNKENLEKFARENYMMKKENEEIFVIE